MGLIATRIGRILLASLIAGLTVWWIIVAGLGVGGFVKSVRGPTDSIASDLAGIVGGLLFLGLLGSLYAGAISLGCGIACAPLTLLIMGAVERRRLAGALTCSLAGAVSAVVSMLALACVIAAYTYARGQPAPFDSLPLLLSLSIGGPIAGFIYWRLARTDLLAA